MTEMEKIEAIAWAARKAGTSYGKFVAMLTRGRMEQIYQDYIDEKARRRREQHRRA